MKKLFILAAAYIVTVYASAQTLYYYPPDKEDPAYMQHLDEEVRFHYKSQKTETDGGPVLSALVAYQEFGYKTAEGKYYIKTDFRSAKYRPYNDSDTLVTMEETRQGNLLLCSPKGILCIGRDLSVKSYTPLRIAKRSN